ncbi:DUF2637 domain-containing protein [Glycomyces sp. NPDC049804]|uniref:DUF2637 domain-containing protein n=1 Tax=Glycomyces sp. NPDC049804 TaxID=3154363 RepID=UPI003432EC18
MTTTDADNNEPALEWCSGCDYPKQLCECPRTPNTTATAIPLQGRTEPEPNTEHEAEQPETEHRTPTEPTTGGTSNTDRTTTAEHESETDDAEPGRWHSSRAWLREWGSLLPIWVLAGALGVAGFASSFMTVEQKMRPYFGAQAWLVPTGTDLGIIVFTLLDIVLARKDKRIPWMRYVPWVLTGATIYLNVTAYSALEAQVAHAVLPSLWVVFCEAIARIMKLKAKEEAKTTRTVPLIRWVCAPIATAILWRAMQLWNIGSYEEALALEEERQLAKAEMKDRFKSVHRAPRGLKVRYRQRKITVEEVVQAAAEHRRGGSPAKPSAPPTKTGSESQRRVSDRRSTNGDTTEPRTVRSAKGRSDRTPTDRTKPVRSRSAGTAAETGSRTGGDTRPANVRLAEALTALHREGVPNPSVRRLAERAGTAVSTAHSFVQDLNNTDDR